MSSAPQILLGGNGETTIALDASMANRHGLIAGATGTGKTVTLQVLAEGFSKIGVPVFLADIKGDLSGLATTGKPHKKIDERVAFIGMEGYTQGPVPTLFWDLFGVKGAPVRTTISEIGPLLLSNLLELNDTQEGVLYACFRIADDKGWLLLDLKDLRSLLTFMGDNAKELRTEYGNFSAVSIGAIQRKLLALEEQRAESFFGEPALDIRDLMQVDFSGNGVVSVLDVTQLIATSPKLYAIFLLWLLAELFEQLPEAGDSDRPKLVFFFDEAHLLFDGAPKALVDKIEQVARLIRSKGVGVYFISQSPLDIPEDVLGQLGMRIQHALRAFTPKDRKTVKAAADSFRPNEKVDTVTAITEMGVGEALVSVLDHKGIPTPVERVMIRPPASRIGPLTDEERKEQVDRSPLTGKYDQAGDRESAYELLIQRAAEQEKAMAEQEAEEKESAPKKGLSSQRQTAGEAFFKSIARSIGGQVGRQIVRGVLGSIFGGRK
jgi:hypothetical protein